MKVDLNKFKKDGYLNIGNILDNNEIKILKEVILNKANNKINLKKFRFSKNLLTENKIFFNLLVNSKIISTIKYLCNDKKIFFSPHTDVHINLPAGKIHRDNTDNCRIFGVGSDWDETKDNYNVFRIAVYLTSYKTSKTSIVIFPGTHKKENLYQNLWFRFFNKTVRFLHSIFPNIQIHQYSPFIKKKIIKVNEGDCVIFDKRVRHAGGVISNNADKISIFFAYGEAENIHTLNDLNWLESEKYITDYPEDLQSLFKINNIKF